MIKISNIQLRDYPIYSGKDEVFFYHLMKLQG